MQEDVMKSPEPVSFRFRNIGPAKDAHMELGDLTVIAGRNNTGKTYLVYTLYGFLKMWTAWPNAEEFFQQETGSSVPVLDMAAICAQLVRTGSTSFPADEKMLDRQRTAVIQALSLDFSESALPQVFSSQKDDFDGGSIEAVYAGDNAYSVGFDPVNCELPESGTLSIQHSGDRVVIKLDKAERRIPYLESYLAQLYVQFLLGDLFPAPFILSAERFGISLFYRELDFTKNQLVDMLQKMGDDKSRERFSPFLLIDQATSRYALPIKDNIDYTRSIPDRRRDKSVYWENRLFDNLKDMMGGYYRATGDEIRFMSKARKKERSFNIPLHLASSSARGLSDLYFFLRHVASRNQLLMIDEPESHLDTENQINLARLLARLVRTGVKVLVTTHSDYLIKEINNLVMLSQEFTDKDAVLKNLKYTADDALPQSSIRAYIAEDNGLTRCEVDRFGIDMPVLDKTIDDINAVANELASRLEQEGSA